MIMAYIILTLVIVDVQAHPCGKLSNIASCKCNDQNSSSVSNPSLCKLVNSYAVSCSCVNGGEWNLPCGGWQNIQSCGPNEEHGRIECLCADESVFVLAFGRRRRRGKGREHLVQGGYVAKTKYDDDAADDKNEEDLALNKLIPELIDQPITPLSLL